MFCIKNQKGIIFIKEKKIKTSNQLISNKILFIQKWKGISLIFINKIIKKNKIDIFIKIKNKKIKEEISCVKKKRIWFSIL